MSDHHEKPRVLEQVEAAGDLLVCSPASVPPALETTEKSCTKVKSKPGTRIMKRSSDVIVNKPRTCASGQAKGARRRHVHPVKGSGKAETNGAEEEDEEDTVKTVRKARSITVDTSKAKTSLEALKLSIRQLKWKEVSEMSRLVTSPRLV